MKNIQLWGVKQNNLKDIEIKIPLGSFTVVCGPSGSGKSSLAFETLYAEGQRRYIESLSNYARQFLNKAPKPDVEGIRNIPPALAIEQKNNVKTSRSTVGTVTEIIDYLRLLFEKIGVPYCPRHHSKVERESVSTGIDKVLTALSDERGYIVVKISASGRVADNKKLLAQLIQDGFLRILLPTPTPESQAEKPLRTQKTKKPVGRKTAKTATAQVQSADEEPPPLTRNGVILTRAPAFTQLELSDPLIRKKGVPKEDFYLVIDRLAFNENDRARLGDSLAQAYEASTRYNTSLPWRQAEVISTQGERLMLSEGNACSLCNYTFPQLSSRLFSFNSPIGACPTCNGFGNILKLDEDKVVPNPLLSLAQGALSPFSMPSAAQDRRALLTFCHRQDIDVHTPWADLPQAQRDMIWHGTEKFFGVEGLFEYLEQKKYKMHVRVFLARFKSPFRCPDCRGSRLRPEVENIRIHEHSITELSRMTLKNLYQVMTELSLSPMEKELADEILRQIQNRLRFLLEVGVHYLTLDRETRTLSGGEYQRINLANQLGMGLSQTLYVLDEPTVGLHPRDNDRLIGILKELKNIGNTLVVVEHDEEVIRQSSHIIEMGPGSGHLGGQVIYSGPTTDFFTCTESITAPYVAPDRPWTPPLPPRPVIREEYVYQIELRGCTGHNLKNVNLELPLNRLVTVTGVSGSGKSSLISQTLYPALARALGVEFHKGLPYQEIKGHEYVKNVLFIDQSPIGKTARSTPASYLKIFDQIRTLFASLPEAKVRGYTPGTFSLNVDGGRCPVCKGLGSEVVNMLFMDDVLMTCDACNGKKYRDEVLEVSYKGKNINQVLALTVEEAMDFFVAYPSIRRPLAFLKEVGLEYIALGQSASSLSGGESQRLKIAREFMSTQQKATLYILDEPTTGLHFREVNLLLKVLNQLIEGGGSVVVIEHNLEIIRNSDFIIDVGPEGGAEGGRIVAQGAPQELAENKKSLTGQYLRRYFEPSTSPQKRRRSPSKVSDP